MVLESAARFDMRAPSTRPATYSGGSGGRYFRCRRMEPDFNAERF